MTSFIITTHTRCIFVSYGAGRLTVEVSRSHSDTPHSVGLPWTWDRSVAETFTCHHTTFTQDRHPIPPMGFEPAMLGSERPHSLPWERAATGTLANASLQEHFLKTLLFATVTKPGKRWTNQYEALLEWSEKTAEVLGRQFAQATTLRMAAPQYGTCFVLPCWRQEYRGIS